MARRRSRRTSGRLWGNTGGGGTPLPSSPARPSRPRPGRPVPPGFHPPSPGAALLSLRSEARQANARQKEKEAKEEGNRPAGGSKAAQAERDFFFFYLPRPISFCVRCGWKQSPSFSFTPSAGSGGTKRLGVNRITAGHPLSPKAGEGRRGRGGLSLSLSVQRPAYATRRLSGRQKGQS